MAVLPHLRFIDAPIGRRRFLTPARGVTVADAHQCAHATQEPLHRGHYAILAKQDGAAEQGVVGLLFGRNKDDRARFDVALVGRG